MRTLFIQNKRLIGKIELLTAAESDLGVVVLDLAPSDLGVLDLDLLGDHDGELGPGDAIICGDRCTCAGDEVADDCFSICAGLKIIRRKSSGSVPSIGGFQSR